MCEEKNPSLAIEDYAERSAEAIITVIETMFPAGGYHAVSAVPVIELIVGTPLVVSEDIEQNRRNYCELREAAIQRLATAFIPDWQEELRLRAEMALTPIALKENVG